MRSGSMIVAQAAKKGRFVARDYYTYCLFAVSTTGSGTEQYGA